MTSLRLTADERVQAEAAGVTAQVEHRAAGAEAGDLPAVVALIAEEARLVPAVEMDAIADSMLLYGHARRQPRARERPARKIFLLRDPLVDADSEVLRAQPLGTKRQDRADSLINSQAEDLDRQDVVEPVDDQAGETIALGMNDAITRWSRARGRGPSFAARPRRSSGRSRNPGRAAWSGATGTAD